MGTFEKLGILVIVVIIVMILAVAIYQWGGTAAEPGVVDFQGSTAAPEPLRIRHLDDLERGAPGRDPSGDQKPAANTWPIGVPKRYVIRPNDMVWKLVVERWKLSESFIQAIATANPKLDMRRLRPGDTLRIPDPAPYVRKRGTSKKTHRPGTRSYEVQIGDTLELVALNHLGSRARWPEIMKVNPGLNPKRLMPGQQIFLPVK